MKKIFLFAAAALAALSVNAKVISFAGIVDNTSADLAQSSFEAAYTMTNLSVKGVANSDGTAYYASITQTTKTTDWTTTTLKLKADEQVYFVFKDNNDNKKVIKSYNDYIQPEGKAVCLVVSGLKAGDKITLNLKKALGKEAKIEGATVSNDKLESTAVELQSIGSEIRVYSQSETTDADGKTTEAKWQLISVEVPGAQAIDNVEAAEKAVKFFENGQLVIIKNGVRYNALGAKL